MALNRLALDTGLFRRLSAVEIDALMLRLNGVSVSEGESKGRGTPQGGVISPLLSKDSTPWVRFFLVEPKSCFHAGDFVTHRGAIASICRRPASLDIGLAFRWPISRARRQMRGDRIKCLGLRTYRTSCIKATDSICRRARMESQSVVKLGQWARVDDKSNRSRSACGNATCGTFQHFTIAPN